MSQIKEFNHLDIFPDQNLCDIKEMEESESIHVDKKNQNKIFYNFNQTKIVNSNISTENNNSISKKKLNVNFPYIQYETQKILNNTMCQNKLPLKTEMSCGKTKDYNDQINCLTKSNNLNSPININNIQKNFENFGSLEKNKLMKNNLIDKRKISEDKKLKIDTEILKKKNMILTKISKENLITSNKLSNEKNEKKISSKNLSGNSNLISTNNSSINSNNANQKQFAKSQKKGK